MKGFLGLTFFWLLDRVRKLLILKPESSSPLRHAPRDGANGVSVNDAIAIMNAIAAQLSTEDIASVAAYFASLPGAAAGAKSAALPNVARTRVTFPQSYKETFTKYHTINFSPAKQVRYYYTNPAALAAARSGKTLPDGSSIFVEVYDAKLDTKNNPITGADGFFAPDKLARYVAMARDSAWGEDIPELLRNENWNYAIFKTDKQYLPINQAECLACHKPLSNVSYLFTLQQLAGEK
jgi:hypothetical protein